jgi:hypothetical protein
VLTAKLNANKNQFNIDTTGFNLALPTPGSYIVVDTEWMQVTAIQNNQVTVFRPNTVVNPAVVHAKDAFVMGTPLTPIVTTVGPYLAGTLGLICMAGPPTGPNTNGTYTFTFVDIGDGTIIPR